MFRGSLMGGKLGRGECVYVVYPPAGLPETVTTLLVAAKLQDKQEASEKQPRRKW